MRLIDADALIEKIDKYLCKPCSSYYGVTCSCCKVDDVNDIIIESPTVDRWIPCNERMPEEKNGQSEEVLVRIKVNKNFSYYEFDYTSGGVWLCHNSCNVTHWMPILDIPKEEEE